MIWAITINTIRMILRRKARWWLLLLIAFFGPLLTLGLFRGDSTLNGLLRINLTYVYIFTSTFLMLLTVYLSATVLDNELTGKQAHTLCVKPVPRYAILIGKWLAVSLVNLGLLIIIGLSTTVLVTYLTRPSTVIALRMRNPDTQRMDAEQRQQDATAQLEIAHRELLTSRTLYTPMRLDVEKEIEEAMQRMKTAQAPDSGRWTKRKMREYIEYEISRDLFSIPYHAMRDFEFENLPQQAEDATLRFRVHGTRPGSAPGILNIGWRMTSPGMASTAQFESTAASSGATEEFPIPGELIDNTGRLHVTILNLSGPLEQHLPPATIHVPIKRGLGIYVPTGSFEANLARGLVLVLIRLLMIAAIGVSANAYIGGSVTSFMLIGVLAIGLFNQTVQAAVTPRRFEKIFEKEYNDPVTLATKAVLRALPDFEETNPLTDLKMGKEIPLSSLLWQAFLDVVLRGGTLFCIGLFAFWRKEIGLPRLHQ